MKQKTLIDLLIDLDQVEKNLERIKNDPEYIKGKAEKIFGNKDYTAQHKEAINHILEMYI